jgi:hypothetical protein
MTDNFGRVLVPTTDVGIVDALGSEALLNLIPQLRDVAVSLELKVSGVWRSNSQYRFDVSVQSELVSDVVPVVIDKDSFDSKTLVILEAMPFLSI